MQFGLIFFASTEETLHRDSRYRLLTESARFADANGFSSVWVPERHFTEFGCLFPNAAVLQAALATITSRVRLQAGSVVLPLHNPLRIAEEWAMVDNLSGGRVGVSFAAGWNPDDFAFFPERYPERQQHLYEGIEQVRHLWRGGKADARNGKGEPIQVKIYPAPVQKELPVWVTAASNPHTFIKAGEIGANLLTHTLDQSIDELALKIQLYRQARAAAGFDPATGQVTVLLHTFLGEDLAGTLALARRPYCQYMKANRQLLRGFAGSRGNEVDISQMSDADMDEFVNFLFDRFARERGLIGTPETCLPLVRQLEEAGVDELACLLDFGPDADQILAHLPYLDALRTLAGHPAEARPAAAPAPEAPHPGSLSDIRLRCGERMTGADFYRTYTPDALLLGSTFRGVQALWIGEGETLGYVELPGALAGEAEAYRMHPALLDACFQVAVAAMPDHDRRGHYLPAGLSGMEVTGLAGGPAAWSYVQRESPGGDQPPRLRATVFNADGEVLLRVQDLVLQRVGAGRRPLPPRQPVYELQWQKKSGPFAPTGPDVIWVICGDASGLAAALHGHLHAQGKTVYVVTAGEAADSAALARIHARHPLQPARLVVLPGSEDPLESSQAAHAALRALPPDHRWHVWFVTRGAQYVAGKDSCIHPAQAPLWGLGRAAALEMPGQWGGLIDLEHPSGQPPALPAWVRLMEQPPADNQFALRGDEVFAPQLVPHPPMPDGTAPAFSPTGTYLVTGGLGGLGLACAEWLVQGGARHLVLVSRRAPAPEAESTLGRLRRRARVEVRHLDVADGPQVQALLSEMGTGMPPLKGIFHLAGVLEEGLITHQDPETFGSVLAAKVQGTRQLHAHTAHLALDYFVLFSSVSSLMPMPGQAAYAAANAFLDAFSRHRSTLGLSGLVVNWGPWREAGHAATAYGRKAHAHLATLGIDALAVEEGFRLLGQLIGRPVVQACVVPIDFGTLKAHPAGFSRSPLLRESQAPAAPAPLHDWQGLSAADRQPALAEYARRLVAQTLKMDPALLEAEEPLQRLGLDSLMAIELRNTIQRDLGVSLGIVQFMQNFTLRQLSDQLLHRLPGLAAPEAAPATPPSDPEPAEAGTTELNALQEDLLNLDTCSEAELDRILQTLGQ